jgi:localization factor PodJL
MNAAGPWSVKGIDPKAREVAKDLARRSGMTLGEWLNQMIIEGEAEAPPFEIGYRSPSSRDSVREAARELNSRDFNPTGEPFRAASAAAKPADLQRINRALEHLTSRIEAAEHRSTLAISGIDQSVMGVLSRLESVERDQSSVAARFDGALQEVERGQAKVSAKLSRMAESDGPRVEAMKALEGAIGKVGQKLYEDDDRTRAALGALREDVSNMSRRIDRTEARADSAPAEALAQEVAARVASRFEQAEQKTSAAVRALEASFADLDARLSNTESRAAPDLAEHRFERLAAELTEKVEAARAEMAERLRAAADGKLEEMEAALKKISGHVEKSEQRSAQAIDRMGREVMRIASSVSDRVTKVEARGAEAVEQVGSEMARIADAMEQRFGRQDTAQAQALEKLGGEIARIAEKLSERIASAERRSAQALDDVGDQLGRVTERLNQRYDRAQTELGDRILQSEERTVKLLDEAREKIDARLSESQRRAALEVAADAARKAAAAESAPAATARADRPASLFDPPSVSETFTSSPFAETPSFTAPSPFAPLASPDTLLDEGAVTGPVFAVDEPHARDLAEPEFTAPPPAAALAFAPEAPAGPTSTRDMLEQARAAARSASEGRDGRSSRRGASDAAPAAGSVQAPPFESEGARSFRFGAKKKRKDGVTIRTALLASGTAAALAVTGAGAVLLVNSEVSGQAERSSDHFGVAPTAVAQNDAPAAQTPSAPSPPISAPSPTAGDQAAVALTPVAGQAEGLTVPDAKSEASKTDSAPAPAPKVSASVLYSAAVRKIASGDASGVEDLKKAANLGQAAAQFYLGKLYETGGAGLSKDLTQARRWTERAADGGDVAAMHNLGLYYYEGEAGPQDPVKAAHWFRRAADAGVKDSQYNLALLYAKGMGVPQNAAEAYKWYLIAAAGGDEGAKGGAQALRAQLTPEAQAAAERAAAAFHAQAHGPGLTASLPTQDGSAQ